MTRRQGDRPVLLHCGDRSPTACADAGSVPVVGDALETNQIAHLSCSFRGTGPESVPSSVASRSPIPTRGVPARDGPRQEVTVIAGTVGDRDPVPELRRLGPRDAVPKVLIETSSSIGSY
ncbi:ATP-dependent helicase DinG [Streptomyces azureus]|uniref:ATP-dependent helicase DinG n=1 Tax=Streptomyces azureus TaxID=146537 RepID=A0A0K8PE89_STRAJ|nr:ATP-dependent helicase DinG [Streptomyces azureus]